MIYLSWADFKVVVDAQNIPIFALPQGSDYYLRIATPDAEFETYVVNGTAAHTTFTTTYLPKANLTFGLRNEDPLDWSQTAYTAVGGQPSTTRAALSNGLRHVVTSISAALAHNSGNAVFARVVLRDGPATTGPIIWSQALSVYNNRSDSCNLGGLSIVGSANTAMTLEFTAAVGDTNTASVALTGHTTV